MATPWRLAIVSQHSPSLVCRASLNRPMASKSARRTMVLTGPASNNPPPP